MSKKDMRIINDDNMVRNGKIRELKVQIFLKYDIGRLGCLTANGAFNEKNRLFCSSVNLEMRNILLYARVKYGLQERETEVKLKLFERWV